MEACEVVRLFVNKAVVSAEPKRRGNPGYGRLKALSSCLCKAESIRERHPRSGTSQKEQTCSQNAWARHSTRQNYRWTWWSRYLSFLEKTFDKISAMLQLAVPTTFLIVDSTPLVDLYDMEARWAIRAEENSGASSFTQP